MPDPQTGIPGVHVLEKVDKTRREVAILYGDVVGYSRLMDLDEERTFQRLRDCLSNHWRPLISDHGGRIVGTGGDSMFVEFARAAVATQCAMAIQTRMREINENVRDEERFVLRIAVNFGEVFDSGDDLYGAAVNVAARLQALTEPGGVMVANTVLAMLPADLAGQFTDAGQRQLKNIAEPVGVHRWVRGASDAEPTPSLTARLGESASAMASGALRLFRRLDKRAPAPVAIPEPETDEHTAGVMVMPFTSLGQDPQDKVLADGMTEELITILGQQSNLRTLARGDSFAHRDATGGAAEMRRRYGVGYVLEGSVRQTGQGFRCTVRLIDTASDRVLWSEQFTRRMEDVFQVQLEIAEAAAFSIQSTVIKEEAFRVRSRPPENLKAWQLVVRANHELFARMNSSSLHLAERLLRNAVEIDPDYAEAWALLALTLAGKVSGGYSLSPEAEDAEAMSMADSALEMAPNDAMVLGAVAATKAHLGDTVAGLRLIDRALAMAPHFAPFHQTKAVALSQAGQHAQAIPILERIIAASPQDLQRHMSLFILAVAYSASGKRAEAREIVEQAIELDPTWHQPHMLLAILEGTQGRIAAGARKIAEARRLEPGLTWDGYDYFYRKSKIPIVKALRILVRKMWKDSERLLEAA